LPPHYPHRDRTVMTDELKGILARAAEQQSPTAAGEPSERDRSPQTTPVEAVLEEYGFTWVADSVRRRRQAAESSVAGKMYR